MINQKGATVGEVLGDGLVLSFYSPSVIQSFFVCLRLTTSDFSYEIPDFGYTFGNLEVIHPLGL